MFTLYAVHFSYLSYLTSFVIEPKYMFSLVQDTFTPTNEKIRLFAPFPGKLMAGKNS